MWWWWLACKKKEPEPLAPPPAVTAPAPADAPPGAEALVRHLSAHDGSPGCDPAALGITGDPAEAFLYVAEHVSMPPVAPMRAAECLVSGHAAAAEPTLTAWMSDPRSEGYARLVVAAWGTLPPDLAVRLARAGLAGPHRDLVAASLAGAPTPELRSLAP